MEEIDRQLNTRNVLEEMTEGTDIGQTVLVPLMQQNNFDVSKCVEVLLEIINDPLPGAEISGDEKRLQEEREMLEKFKKEMQLADRLEQQKQDRLRKEESERFEQEMRIAEELIKKNEVESKIHESELRAAAEKEKENQQQISRELAQIRADLEEEWTNRMEQQEKELDLRRKRIEADKAKVLKEQLKNVADKKSEEFKNLVEIELQKRMLQAQKEKQQREKEASERKEEKNTNLDEDVVVEVTAPKKAETGTKITVYYEYKLGRPSKSDWIGYYKKSRAEDSNDYYVYQKTGGKEKGSVEFLVPAKLGICEFRFFQNNSYKVASKSDPVRVGNSVLVDAVVEGSIIRCKVAYDDDKARSSWDWMGLYEHTETRNKMYYKGLCAYVKSDRSVEFKAPRKPGRYVVRYFQSGSGYSELACSKEFDIGDKDEMKVAPNALMPEDAVDVVWHIESVECKSKDWVGLYKIGTPFNAFNALAMQHTRSKKPDGSLKFILSNGLESGDYEFVFVQARSGTVVKRSNSFHV